MDLTYLEPVGGRVFVSWTVSVALGNPSKSSQPISVVQKKHRIKVIAVHVGGDVVPVMTA